MNKDHRLHLQKHLNLNRKVFKIFSILKKQPFFVATPPPAPADADVETRIDVAVKHPEVILLEDQHNSNSNCLVLDVSFYLNFCLLPLYTKNLLVGFTITYDSY